MNRDSVQALVGAGILSVAGQSVAQEKTSVELFASSPIEAGQTVRLKLTVTPSAGAHVYYLNPGEMGFPVEVAWENLPEGVSVSDLEFPVPHRVSTGDLSTYGYEGPTHFYANLSATQAFEVPAEPLRATVSWLACTDAQCVPGSQGVEFAWSAPQTFDESEEDKGLPVAAGGDWETSLAREGETWVLTVKAPAGFEFPAPKSLDLFCEDSNIEDPTRKPEFERQDERTLRVVLAASEYPSGKKAGEEVTFVLAGLSPARKLKCAFPSE